MTIPPISTEFELVLRISTNSCAQLTSEIMIPLGAVTAVADESGNASELTTRAAKTFLTKYPQIQFDFDRGYPKLYPFQAYFDYKMRYLEHQPMIPTTVRDFMKILLPPSEGKSFGTSKKTIKLAGLSFSELNPARELVMQSLIKVSSTKTALSTLGLTPGLASELESNLTLLKSPTSPAIEIYDGVLYQSLGYSTLSASARANTEQTIVIASSLFGFLSPQDCIPHYRLSGDVNLPKLGTVSNFWRARIAMNVFGDELVIDMRSGTYEKFWRPAPDANFANIKVMQVDSCKGQKIAVSHFNKATKGEITKALLTSRQQFKTVASVANEISKAGWEVEVIDNPRTNSKTIEVMIK
jgi:cytoplasmic iron level regulating protein YaaA (DUF328/UPF0246 family)